MGLTISYQFEFRGTKTEVRERLTWLKSRFEKMPVRSVGDITEVERAADTPEGRSLALMMGWTYFEKSAAERGIEKVLADIGGFDNIESATLTQKRRFVRHYKEAEAIDARREQRIAHSGNGLTLHVNPSEGSEYFTIVLGRLGKGKLWRGGHFTKTQYAEDFFGTHLRVIDLLDLCQEACILRSVNDEGGYWDTRDLDTLAGRIGEYDALVTRITRQLQTATAITGLDLKAPVEEVESLPTHRRKPDLTRH